MTDHFIFAGVDISSGRKPITLAVLDATLNILLREQQTVTDSVACLSEYKDIILAINSPVQKPEHKLSAGFKREIIQAGFDPISKNASPSWVETDTQKCFLALCANKLLPRRTLDGRIQRALILYDGGVQIPDPMDFFEEITRHKVMQGILPVENVYATRELDALMAAYMAWMALNEPRQIQLMGNRIMPSKQAGE